MPRGSSAWPQNLQRLRRTAQLVRCADLRSEPPRWWDGRPFDRILLDAPCSATGVIRRHPDIKLLRRAGDIEALAATQRPLLERCLACCGPAGGCCIRPARCCRRKMTPWSRRCWRLCRAARALPPETRLAPAAGRVRVRAHGVQLLPGNAALTDGFYYACLTVT